MVAYRRARQDRMSSCFKVLREALTEAGYPRKALSNQADILAVATEFVLWALRAQAPPPPAYEPVPQQSPEVTAFFARD